MIITWIGYHSILYQHIISPPAIIIIVELSPIIVIIEICQSIIVIISTSPLLSLSSLSLLLSPLLSLSSILIIHTLLSILLSILLWLWVNTYRYIFSGMNIHKSQLFWGSLGTRVLTHTIITIITTTMVTMDSPKNQKPFASRLLPDALRRAFLERCAEAIAIFLSSWPGVVKIWVFFMVILWCFYGDFMVFLW